MHRRLLSTALVALLATPTLAQDEEDPRPEGIQLPEGLGAPQDDRVEELKQLFLEVERKLAEIDLKLADAGAGDASLAEVPDAGIDDLLKQTLAHSTDVQVQIGRILEIAQEMNQGQGSGSGQQQPSSGESPLDQQRDTGPQQREQTPEAPQSQQEGQQEGGEEPEHQQGQKPQDGPQQDQPGGENRAGAPQDPQAGDPATRGDDAQTWGFLPERVRETFRRQGRDDLPVRYRDWIDAYYRRLNEERR